MTANTSPRSEQPGALGGPRNFWVVAGAIGAFVVLVIGLWTFSFLSNYQRNKPPRRLFVSMHARLHPGMSRIDALQALADSRGADSGLDIWFTSATGSPWQSPRHDFPDGIPSMAEIQQIEVALDGLPEFKVFAVSRLSHEKMYFIVRAAADGSIAYVEPAFRRPEYSAPVQLSKVP